MSRSGRLALALGLASGATLLLWYGLTARSPSDPLPSALLSKEAPPPVASVTLAVEDAANGLPTTFVQDPAEGWPPVTLVNFWGSWCLACEQEMPELALLEAEFALCRLAPPPGGCPRLVGVDFHDPEIKAREFLARHGAAYENVFDLEGRIAIDWGVYGAPETFFLDRQGVIRHRHVGPLGAAEAREWIRRIAEAGP